MKRVYGWVTPECEYFSCKPFEHWTVVNNTPKLRAYVPDANRIERNVAITCQYCQDLEAQGEHGEWHDYENACDDARTKAIAQLYKAGCVRLADKGMVLNAEGIEAAWTPEMGAFLKKFAKDCGYKLHREDRKSVV